MDTQESSYSVSAMIGKHESWEIGFYDNLVSAKRAARQECLRARKGKTNNFDRAVIYGGETGNVIKVFSVSRSGTAPDTSIFLGNEHRVWLKSHGGIQPTIHAMIDRAMKRNP